MFAAIDSETVPLPVPLAPAEIDSHGALLAADQEHVGADAVTATDTPPPAEATLWLVGEIVNVHGGGGGAPGCVTVTATPAIVSEPLRSPPLLAAAENAVVPAPVPEAPAVIVIHGAPLVAVHVQVASDGVTAKLPLAPPVATDCVDGETLNVQDGGGGGGGGGAAAPWLIVNVCPPIVTVPLRAAPLLAAALIVTLPLPVPLAAVVTVIHGAFDVAVHAHDAAPVTVTVVVAVPPSGAMVAFDGDRENVHGGGAAVCVTVTVCPPTVIVPDRSPPPLAATLKGIEALPVPDEVPRAIHGAALDAAHAHVLCDAATVTVPLPPAAANDCGLALTVNVHGGGAPACVTANVWPATVTMPLRSFVAVFAATSRRTVPLPLPFAPAPIVIHGVLEDADHVQPAPAATETVTDPPAAATLAFVADSVKVHGGGGGPGSGVGVGVGVGVGDGEGVGGATPACVTTTDSPAM